MATRSRIGIDNPDGTITSIYCHFDGYPEGVGRVLAEHYTDEGKIRALLALGDISVLGAELGEDQGTGWFDARGSLGLDDPRRGWTLAYGRDRGEQGTEAVTHGYFEWPDSGQEHEYLYSTWDDTAPRWLHRSHHFAPLVTPPDD